MSRCASHSSNHAGSSRFGSMREAAAQATGHAHYHTDRPVERAAAAAVAQYPEPSVSTEDDANDDVEADFDARLSWAKSIKADRQASNSGDTPQVTPLRDPALVLQQRREQLQQEEGMPRPAVRTEHSARSRNNSRVQWALPDDEEEEEEEEERREAERERGRQGGITMGEGGNGEGPTGESFVGSVDSTVGVSSRETSVTSAKKGKGQAKVTRSGDGEQSLGEWARSGAVAAHGMVGEGGSGSLPVRDASGGHGQQAAAARMSAASSSADQVRTCCMGASNW
ncbi:hypothetical protein DUNSADRAFT_4736 [Dunaliella salina]|uniref:Encoded protein n=1 Tax=Dunaliella salina TaxID=3046 RepID=A0ABQ7GRE3_DUNSA|nr:hypothetical protein DUNSADRAFT_4736 [Dunaliella salina]|eukprot:KAF5837176.1 hypothetical protein DUNSADRAFT_4736 [Dunaliella salina]